MNEPAVTQEICLMLIRKYLSALRKYPVHEDGQRCLAMYLSQYALSVSHAESIVRTFHQECPTPGELHDIAFDETARGKFLPPAKSLKEKWMDEGCTYDPGYYDRIQAELQFRKPGDPREIDLMYRAVKRKLGIRDWTNVSWGCIWSTARELGFPLNTEQAENADQYERSQPKKTPALPTVEHIES